MKLSYVAIISLAWFFASCQMKEEIKPPKDKEKPMTQSLRINNQGDLASIHPHYGADLPCRVFQKALFEGLTRLDEKDKPILALAKEYELSEDNCCYTFHLRPSFWSNGEKVTADHFKRSWLEAIKPDSACIRADLFYAIKNAKEAKMGLCPLQDVAIKVVDDNTLVIGLVHPAPYFLELLANPIFSPLYDTKTEPTVFNGPFVVASYDHEKELVLQKNPLYWDLDNVYLEKITTSFVKDPSTAVMMYEKGELDWVGAPFTMLPTDFLKHAKLLPHYVSKPIAAVYSYACNVEKPPMNSKKIRQALSLVLDRNSLCEHVLLGETPSKALLPPGITHLQEDDLYQDHNIAKAKELFQEGLSELHLTKETMPPLEISYSDIPGQKALAMALQQIWENVFDVKVNLSYTEWNHLFNNLITKNYLLAGYIWFTAYQDATYNLDSLRDNNNRFNIAGWEHPHFQHLLDLANQETDLPARNEYLRQAELLLLDEMPLIPIYVHHSKYLVSDAIQGIRFSLVGQVDFKGMYVGSAAIQR